jgi:hypothetical protein
MSIGDKIRAQRLSSRGFTANGWNAALDLAADIANAEAAELVGAAYEDAAQAAFDAWMNGCPPAEVSDAISARTPANAQAALDQIRAERDKALADLAVAKEALAGHAKQRLSSEMTLYDRADADFEGGYDELVQSSRAALARITKAAP